MGTWGNVLISHLLLVIPAIPVILYTFVSSCVTKTLTHTHTHTLTLTHTLTHTHTHTQTHTDTHRHTQTHTHTQTQRHTQTQTHTKTQTHKDTDTHTHTDTQWHTHTHCTEQHSDSAVPNPLSACRSSSTKHKDRGPPYQAGICTAVTSVTSDPCVCVYSLSEPAAVDLGDGGRSHGAPDAGAGGEPCDTGVMLYGEFWLAGDRDASLGMLRPFSATHTHTHTDEDCCPHYTSHTHDCVCDHMRPWSTKPVIRVNLSN